MAAYFMIGRMEKQWHVNQPLPFRPDDVQVVVEVQADCDELEAIKRQFINLPMTNGRVVRWFGDHARFIAANLKVGHDKAEVIDGRTFLGPLGGH